MSGKELNLLILEDEPDDAELEVKELERKGFIIKWRRVETESAFRKALEDKPDLILADLKLEGMSAFQVCRQLMDVKNPLNENTWQTPFIVTTSRIRGRDKQYAMSLGVGFFLEKPLSPSQLCPRIEKLIGPRRAK